IVEITQVEEPKTSSSSESVMTQNEPELILVPISAPEESPSPGNEVPSLGTDQETQVKDAAEAVSVKAASSWIPGSLSRLWLASALTVGLWQAWRMMRFRRRLKKAIPAPEWLASEVAAFAALLNVGPPRIAVLPGIASPLVWGLGGPVLVWPGELS